MAGRSLVVLTFLLVLGCFSPHWGFASQRSETADRAQAGLARVDSLMEAGATSAAVSEARALVRQLGNDPLYGWQIEGRLGIALLRDGHPSEALPYLEEFVARHPHDPVAHRNFASALLALGRKGRALTEFRLVVELAPADYEARLEFGQVLAEFGDVRSAATHLEVARSLCPECTAPDLALAGAFLEASDYLSAIEPLQRLMTRDPTPWTRRNLGLALAGAGRDAEVLAFIDALSPERLSAEEMNLVVVAEGNLGLADRSCAYLETAADPEATASGLPEGLLISPEFWGRVSLNLLAAGHDPAALEAVNRAVTLDEKNVVYLNNRVVILLKLGRDEEAAQQWQEVLKLDPSLEKKESE